MDKKLSPFEWLGLLTGGFISLIITFCFDLYVIDYASVVATNGNEAMLKFMSYMFLLFYVMFEILSITQMVILLLRDNLSIKEKQITYVMCGVVWLMTLILTFTTEMRNTFGLVLLNMSILFVIVISYKVYCYFFNK